MHGSYLGSPLLVQQLDVLLEVVDVGHLTVVGRVSFRDRGVPDLIKLVNQESELVSHFLVKNQNITSNSLLELIL